MHNVWVSPHTHARHSHPEDRSCPLEGFFGPLLTQHHFQNGL